VSKKILIIEDNEQNLYLSTFLLENKGYDVIQARDGYAGIEIVENENPDLLLLDIQLPGIDGYSIAEQISKMETNKDLPIIAVTSYAMVGDREKAMDSGCTGYIEKPINPDTFVNEIEKFFREFI